MKNLLMTLGIILTAAVANAGAYLKCECNVDVRNRYERVDAGNGQSYNIFYRDVYHRLWVLGADLQWNNIQTYGSSNQCESYLQLLSNAGHCPGSKSYNNNEASEPYYN